MEQYEFHISDLQRILRKRYRIVLGVMALTFASSFFFARMKVPIYKASAAIKVDRNSLAGLGMDAMIYGTWDNIETETEVLTSFPVLLRAAKKLKLIHDSIPNDSYPSDVKILNTLSSIRAKVTPSISGRTNIIRIEAQSGKPEGASEIANAIAFSYRDFCRDMKKMHATKTKLFVEDQLDHCKGELALAEGDLRSFEEQQEIPSISEDTRFTINKSIRIQDELKKTVKTLTKVKEQERELRELLNNKKMLAQKLRKMGVKRLSYDSTNIDKEGHIDEMGWVSELTDRDPGLRNLNQRLIQLQIKLADQTSYYTKVHPSSKEIEQRVAETIGQILAKYKKHIERFTEEKVSLEKENDYVERDLRKLPANQMQYTRLVRKLEVNEELYSLLAKKYQEARISEAGVVDDVNIMSVATASNHPTNINLQRTTFIGIIFGLVLGLIMAVLRELFDTSIGTIDEVERTLKTPVLAVVPHIAFEMSQNGGNGKKRRKKEIVNPGRRYQEGLISHFLPKDPCSEAFRILRTNIEYLLYNKPFKTILITSATMQEGKSTVVANIGITLAQQGKKVCILECNLRRPRIYKIFGLRRGPGIADILINKVDRRDCVNTIVEFALADFPLEEICETPGIDNLNIITYGHTPPNPVELLSDPKMEKLINEVKQNYDIVLLDAPPLLPVADSIVLSNKVDCVFLVYRAGKVPRNSLRLGKERVEAVSANLLGIILNDIRPETTGTPMTSIYYRYQEKNKPGQKKARKVKKV